MWKKAVDDFRCPACRATIGLDSVASEDPPGNVQQGRLKCTGCEAVYEIHNGLPRFVGSEEYASSFGYEWTIHSATQVDKSSATTISRDRFYGTTRWPKDLSGQRILEAGSGSGRFSQVALEAGAELFSFDLSVAVDSNLRNNGLPENFTLFQGSIYDIPLKQESFDKVFCLGVLQHTPDVKASFMNLIRYLKPGGQLAIDLYKRTWKTTFSPKYLLRPMTKRLPKPLLYKLCRTFVPILAPIRHAVAQLPVVGYLGHLVIPVSCYRGAKHLAPYLTREQLREWEILDTFDMYSPAYDSPQSLETVQRWCEEAGLVDIYVRYGQNGVNATATKPAHEAS